jgi:hypothetical protein
MQTPGAPSFFYSKYFYKVSGIYETQGNGDIKKSYRQFSGAAYGQFTHPERQPNILPHQLRSLCSALYKIPHRAGQGVENLW